MAKYFIVYSFQTIKAVNGHCNKTTQMQASDLPISFNANYQVKQYFKNNLAHQRHVTKNYIQLGA